MEVELDIILDKGELEMLKIFCERSMKGRISDMEWREYQLNGLLGNSQTLKMNGYKDLNNNSITYVFTEGLLLGCIEEGNSVETPFKSVTHVVTRVHIGDAVPKALVKILDTHHGKMVKALLEDGFKLSIIPRFFPNKRISRLDIV